MSWWSRLRIRTHPELELNTELETHIRMQIEESVHRGVSEAEARRLAHLELGGLEQTKEQYREARSGAWVDALLVDLKYAFRGLRRSPAFTAVAVMTMALGIGASTAIFTIVDSVLLRPLGFFEPQRLVMVRPSSGARLSPAYLHEWRAKARSFQDMAGWHDVRANLTGGGAAIEVFVDRVTPNFFALLGTPARLGRTLTLRSDLSQVEPEVVLSYRLWQRRYAGDVGVIGRSITLDGKIFTIVGVMPEGFAVRTTELAESRAELWTPLSLVGGDRAGMGGFLNVIGRLMPGVSASQAGAELAAIARAIEQEHPSYSHNWGVEAVPLLDATVKDVRLPLLVLLGAVGILLLIACANVANLLLSRAVTRQAELAIRISLGATAPRLARQFITEGFLLASLGGAFGIVFAMWGTQALVSALPAGFDLPRAGQIEIDSSVLAFACFAITLTAIFFGLVPSAMSIRSVPQSALREAKRTSSPAVAQSRLRSTLIVSEVALAMVLLAVAVLLGRSFFELNRVDPGFRTDHVLTMRTTLPESGYNTDERIRAFSRELLGRIEHLPGVLAAGSVNYLPMSRFGAANRFEIEGRPEGRLEDQKFSWSSVVGGRYFEAMGIPLLRGRLPGPADTERAQPVVIIDELLARHYWPDASPIGARIAWRRGETVLSGEIIGVVGAVRWGGLASNPPATTYFWFPQEPNRELTIVVRAADDSLNVAPAVAAQVGAIDSNQPVAEIQALRSLVSADLARPRLLMMLFGSFAVTALFLAAIGLYGVIAFAITQQTQELGIRIALGARHADVLQMVMQRGMLLTAAGLAIGTAAVLAIGRALAGLIYGIASTDPVTILAAALFLALVAAIATYLPARQAARLDPMVALRAD